MRLGARHPLQAPAEGERVVIVGTGEQAQIAFEYFSYDSPYEVVAFSTEPQFVKAATFCGRPVVPLDQLAAAFPPAPPRVSGES